jgi:hypothetical protein
MAKNKQVKIKKSHVKWAAVAVILILAAVILFPYATNNTQEPVEKINITEIVDTSNLAERGDLLTINYVLRLDNGKIVDTNNADLAKEAGLTTYTKGPYKFILGQSNKLPTFDQAIEGLKVGEKQTIIIKPTEQVLTFKINITDKKPRRILYPRIKPYTFAEYESKFKEPAIVNNIISNIEELPWPLQIINVTEKYVVTQAMVRAGDSFFVPGQEWKSQVLRLSDKVVEFVQDPKIGLVFDTPYGTAEMTNVTISNIFFTHTPVQGKELKQKITDGKQQGKTFDFEVLDVGEDSFVIRRTNYLAQELANIEVEVLEIVKDVKEI